MYIACHIFLSCLISCICYNRIAFILIVFTNFPFLILGHLSSERIKYEAKKEGSFVTKNILIDLGVKTTYSWQVHELWYSSFEYLSFTSFFCVTLWEMDFKYWLSYIISHSSHYYLVILPATYNRQRGKSNRPFSTSSRNYKYEMNYHHQRPN